MSNSRPAFLYAACASNRRSASAFPSVFACLNAFLHALQQWQCRGSLTCVFGDGSVDRLDAITLVSFAGPSAFFCLVRCTVSCTGPSAFFTLAHCTGPPAFFGLSLRVAFTGFFGSSIKRPMSTIVCATDDPGVAKLKNRARVVRFQHFHTGRKI